MEEWNILCLCATHHVCFDEDELYDHEWAKIEAKVKGALARVKLSGERFGRQGLPWFLKRVK